MERLMAQENLFALLVSDGEESFESLRTLLMSRGIEVRSSRTRTEAACLLEKTRPEIIFTATQPGDGTWRDIVILAEKAAAATNVIVVGKSKDMRLYFAAMDYGAFDFILPPFESEPVGHIVRAAAESVRRQREAQAGRAIG
jgi:DNA-binding NtrC family response regulator